MMVKLKFLLIILLGFLYDINNVLSVERKSSPVSEKVLSDPVGVSQFFQMFLGLVLIVGLILGLAWLVKRINNYQGNMNGVLKLLSMISVGQREKIVLIQIGKQQLLIGVAPGKVNTLLVLNENIESAEVKRITVSFADKLSAVLKGNEPKS
ncbi:hypothetical protein MNBD_GAMMA22-553 [hydrothermal vent metagenome]|uniref:Flagellar protein n=1 Tax=hydrothermal vent metagenome TaxID=652676 RepID=A0A3B1A032_9ZZZZ